MYNEWRTVMEKASDRPIFRERIRWAARFAFGFGQAPAS